MGQGRFGKRLLCALVLVSAATCAQERHSGSSAAELRLHIVSLQPGKHHSVPAVIWLEPLAGTPALPFSPHSHYTLLQKNRTFTPHLQVIPVGSVVQFPNADPFFHNVFSLFEGKRFDLGLYEAGSSKSVNFAREGVSYIFCNIHPEMSAVILTLSTPFYSIADANDFFLIRDVPPGNYEMHIWIEGVPQSTLDGLAHFVHFSSRTVDLGELKVAMQGSGNRTHTNEFGRPYDPDSNSTY
jgi:hypothetical protein